MTASKCKLQELREPLLCLDLEREDCFILPFADLLGAEPILSVFASDRGRIQEKIHGALIMTSRVLTQRAPSQMRRSDYRPL